MNNEKIERIIKHIDELSKEVLDMLDEDIKKLDKVKEAQK